MRLDLECFKMLKGVQKVWLNLIKVVLQWAEFCFE